MRRVLPVSCAIAAAFTRLAITVANDGEQTIPGAARWRTMQRAARQRSGPTQPIEIPATCLAAPPMRPRPDTRAPVRRAPTVLWPFRSCHDMPPARCPSESRRPGTGAAIIGSRALTSLAAGRLRTGSRQGGGPDPTQAGQRAVIILRDMEGDMEGRDAARIICRGGCRTIAVRSPGSLWTGCAMKWWYDPQVDGSAWEANMAPKKAKPAPAARVAAPKSAAPASERRAPRQAGATAAAGSDPNRLLREAAWSRMFGRVESKNPFTR